MKVVILLALVCVACGQQGDMIQGMPMFSNVDSELQFYFQNFSTLTGVSTEGITAGFTSLPTNVAGECVWGGAWNEVRIDTASWNTYNWTLFQREQLISHELGHCALFLKHINNCSDGSTAPDGTESTCNEGIGMPLSIMNWQMFNSYQAQNITQNYYDYLKLNEPIP